MAADSERGAKPAVTAAAPAPVMVTRALRASAAISSVTHSRLPAASSASRSSSPSGSPPARTATSSASRLAGEPRELNPRIAERAPQRHEIIPLRDRAHHSDE